MAARSGVTCTSALGMTTANGRYRRQSVASVACETMVNGSKRTFSFPTMGASVAIARARRPGISCSSRLSSSSAPREAAITSRTSASPPRSLHHGQIPQVLEEAPAARGRLDELLVDACVPAVDGSSPMARMRSRRAAGDAPGAQLLDLPPHLLPEEVSHRLAVVGGGVVERDLARCPGG
jgi:hypothetical protein